MSRRRCVSIAAVTALAGCLRFQDDTEGTAEGGAEEEGDNNPDNGELDVEWVFDPPETVGESPELAIVYEGATDDPTVEVEYYRNGQAVDTFTTTGNGGAGIVRHSRAWDAGGTATVEIAVRDGEATSTETIEFELEPEASDIAIVDLRAEDTPQTVGERDTYAVEYEGAAMDTDIRVEWRLDGDVVDRAVESGRGGSDIVPLDHQWEAAGRAELVVIVTDGAASVEERMRFNVERSAPDDEETEETEDEEPTDSAENEEAEDDTDDEQLTIIGVDTETPQERGREYTFRVRYEHAEVPGDGVNVHFLYQINDRMRRSNNISERSSAGRVDDSHEWDRTGQASVEVTVTDQDSEVSETIDFDVEES